MRAKLVLEQIKLLKTKDKEKKRKIFKTAREGKKTLHQVNNGKNDH